MNILVVDDQPEFLIPFFPRLEGAGITIQVLRDLGDAWLEIAAGARFDLVVIHIAFDSPASEFQAEQSLSRESLVQRGYGGLAVSGQALGIRILRERQVRQTPYSYTTNHQNLWIENIPSHDPEFAGGLPTEHDTIIDKAQLWLGNVVDKLQAAQQEWARSKRLSRTGQDHSGAASHG